MLLGSHPVFSFDIIFNIQMINFYTDILTITWLEKERGKLSRFCGYDLWMSPYYIIIYKFNAAKSFKSRNPNLLFPSSVQCRRALHQGSSHHRLQRHFSSSTKRQTNYTDVNKILWVGERVNQLKFKLDFYLSWKRSSNLKYVKLIYALAYHISIQNGSGQRRALPTNHLVVIDFDDVMLVIY